MVAPVIVVLPFLAALLGGCAAEPEAKTMRVRGLYVGQQFEGLVAVIHHEDIPGVMGPMQMSFKLDEPAELADIPRGSAIAFDLVMQGDDWRIRRIELLPDTTRLQLEADSPSEHDPVP